jgi:hypothetical protein
MSKRIITSNNGGRAIFDGHIPSDFIDEIMRVYDGEMVGEYDEYMCAVLIPDDAVFEGL